MRLLSWMAGAPGPRVDTHMEISHAAPHYADLARAVLSRDAMVVDFAALPPSGAGSSSEVDILLRLAMNLYNAKRMLVAFEKTVERYEQTFGTIAEDAQRQREDQRAVLVAGDLEIIYVNYVQVTGTPEEVVFDFGLNPHSFADRPTSLAVSSRIVMDHYATKQLAAGVARVVQEHEQRSGTLVTDAAERIKPGIQRWW